jgi:hypothetical protein
MDFFQSSLGNKQYQDELNKYLMNLKKQKDSKLPASKAMNDPKYENYSKNVLAVNKGVPFETQMQFPEMIEYYGGNPITSMGGRGIEKKQDVKKQIKAEAKMVQADPLIFPEGYVEPGFLDTISDKYDNFKKNLSNMFSTSEPAKTGTTATGQPAKSQDMATGTESPKPQEDEFGNRMAATAVGNILGSLGAGLAGYSPTSVNQMFQGLYGQLMQRQKEKEERDPNSVVSKNYRDMIQPYLPKGVNLEGKSAFDLKQTVPYMISQAEREADRQFKASESAKDRASMERRFKDAYSYKVDERQKKREDKVFGELTKGAQEIYDVNEARGLLKDIQEMKSIISKRSPASLTAGRARGIFGIGGDPFGFEDVDIKRLETIKTGLINKLVKDSGESGALSQADKIGFEKGFTAVNSGNLNAYLTAIENRIEQTRQDRINKFNKRIQSANKQYGTDYNAGDFIDSFDATPQVEQKANEIPKFELKL